MYSYLPKEYLILGLKSKEMNFSNFEENMRLDSDMVSVALEVSLENVEHIPSEFWNESNFDLLQRVQSSYNVSGPLNLELHIQMPQLRDKLFEKDYFFKLAFDILNSNCTEDRIFNALHMLREELEHPFFNSPEYLEQFLSFIEEFCKSNNLSAHSALQTYKTLGIWVFAHIENLKKTNIERANAFLSNFKILNYFLLAELSFNTPLEKAFPQEMLKDSEKMLAFFEFLKYESTYPWREMESYEIKDFFADPNDKYKDYYVKALIILSASFQYFTIADLPEDILISPKKFKAIIEEVRELNFETVIISDYAFLEANVKADTIYNMFKNELFSEILINYVSDSMSYFTDVVRYGVVLGGNSSHIERMNYFINILEKVDVEKMSSNTFKSFNTNFASIIVDFNLIENEVAYGTGVYIDKNVVTSDDKDQMKKIISHVIKKYKESN